MKDNIADIGTGYKPEPKMILIKSAELQEIQSTLIYLADEVLLLSKTVQALTRQLKQSKDKQ
jgi:hypothetical protein